METRNIVPPTTHRLRVSRPGRVGLLGVGPCPTCRIRHPHPTPDSSLDKRTGNPDFHTPGLSEIRPVPSLDRLCTGV